MTASAHVRPRRHGSADSSQPAGASGRAGSRPRSWAARRTLLALLASALGAVPLKGLLSDSGWLLDVWFSMAVVILPAALLRLRRPPNALDIWPGVVLLIPWLTARFVPGHALLGLIPAGGAWHDVQGLLTSLHQTTRYGVAPVHSTPAVRLVLCALLGLLAALVDLIAVVGRRGALAGAPLLVVYTVSGAIPRTPVAWLWFAAAAAGFLVLLALNADDELERWGRRIPRADGSWSTASLPVSAPRIAIAAVVVAVVVPLALPAHPHNVLADAFHNSGGSGSGVGLGAGTSISPYANLKGELTRGKPLNLMTVRVLKSQSSKVPPFYLRTNVLDDFTGTGWRVSDHGATVDARASNFASDPPAGGGASLSFEARVSILALGGNAPVFDVPSSIDGLAEGVTWSRRDQLLLGTSVSRGDVFTETFAQSAPSASELASAPNLPSQAGRWLELPTVPSYVTTLVRTLTDGASSDYARGRAISDYFAAPKNGFQYTLSTKKGDSGNDLVDFLKNKQGYCQQYAGAMAVMLRAAGVPARVVLGYMHDAPDSSGSFTVTTLDAHAWVEAYFPGVGWTPFDPTPIDGLNGGAKSDLGYAPHVYPSGTSDVGDRDKRRASTAVDSQSAAASASRSAPKRAPTAVTKPAADHTALWVWLGLLAALLIALTPAAARLARRRKRLAAGRSGDAGALWDELSDTAVDLGYVWSAARSPRQVAAWLARDASSAPELTALATAVERRRYAPPAGPAAATEALDRPAGTEASAAAEQLTRDLTRVTARLRAHRAASLRLRARLAPASLGLTRLGRSGVRRRH